MTVASHQYNRVFDAARQDSLSLLAQHIQPGTTVLELGPATGYFTRHLHDELKCTVDAVEMDALMAEQAQQWCRKLVVGNLEQLQLAEHFSPASYDTVICADVLEHLRDPLALLRQAIPLLNRQGQILVSIPNVGYAGLIADLLQGEFTYREEGLLDRTHLRFFTRTSLETMLRQAGLYVWQWHAMERPLWDSEFRTRLETLPSAWAETLLGQPHALCYQWIAAARTTPPPQVPTPPVMGGHDRFPVRLFWRSATETFDYPHSKVAWGNIGQTGQTLNLDLPAGSYAQLRLSLADRPGFVRLRALRLRDTSGTLLWQWQAGQGDLLEAGADGMHGTALDGQYHVVLENMESWLNLPIPVALPDGGLTLQIDLDWPASSDYVALLPLARDELAQVRQTVTAREHLIAERDALLALRTEQLSEREHLIAERDALLTLRTEQLNERDSLLALRTEQLSERDALLTQRIEQLNERDSLLALRTEQIATLEQQLDYRASLDWWLKSPLRLIRGALKRIS